MISHDSAAIFYIHASKCKVRKLLRISNSWVWLLHASSKANRHVVKSPQKSKKSQEKSGVGWLPGGVPYIHGWPTGRRPAKLADLPTQTVAEAASWCKKVWCFDPTFDPKDEC